jgi:hypothetical protein
VTDGSAPASRRVLTPEQVCRARERAAAGERVSQIAADLNLKYATVSAAVRGYSFAWITDPAPVRRNLQSPRVRRTDDERAELVDLALSLQADYPGLTTAAVARRLDVNPATLRSWIRARRRAQG